jgi:hypothetical protein
MAESQLPVPGEKKVRLVMRLDVYIEDMETPVCTVGEVMSGHRFTMAAV